MHFISHIVRDTQKIAKGIPLSLTLFFLLENSANASYYDVLPKGVRNFTFRFVQTGNITGSFNNDGIFKGNNISANIDAATIKGLSGAVDAYLDSLSAADREAFSLGSFEGKAVTKITAQGLGGGIGVTDKLTIYALIPFFSAEVNLNVRRTSKGKTTTAADTSVIQLENIPDVDLRLIQSLFVNYYNYRPLGTWKASAFGDAEFGFLYQLKKWKNAGALISMGAVAPTGRRDNPDILQDISFGDGQWDLFYEFGGGFIFSKEWALDLWSRLTYQTPFHSIIRLPESESFPVTKSKGEAKIKLGNKYAGNTQLVYNFNDQFSTGLVYGIEYVEKSKYQSTNPLADKILEKDTEKITHLGRLNLNFSTISLYNAKKFFLPFGLTLSGQSVFAGRNVPKYERADLEVRFFF